MLPTATGPPDLSAYVSCRFVECSAAWSNGSFYSVAARSARHQIENLHIREEHAAVGIDTEGGMHPLAVFVLGSRNGEQRDGSAVGRYDKVLCESAGS